jgi:hypothetical protein
VSLIERCSTSIEGGKQWCSGRMEAPGLNLCKVTFCLSVSLSKTLNPLASLECKWTPVITGKVACNGPASHPGGNWLGGGGAQTPLTGSGII